MAYPKPMGLAKGLGALFKGFERGEIIQVKTKR
jgi:hypothetical protein